MKILQEQLKAGKELKYQLIKLLLEINMQLQLELSIGLIESQLLDG